MKVFISADIEGVACVTDWDETEAATKSYEQASEQMTNEVVSACKAALDFGADEVVVKDAHDSARNIIIDRLPKEVKISRGWTNTPESMVAGVDESFDAMIFTGYHAGASFGGNPLAHTMNTRNNYIKVNGKKFSEFDINALISESYNVPVVFVSGDERLCEHAKTVSPNIETAGVKSGLGGATLSVSPKKSCEMIYEGVQKGLNKIKDCHIEIPEIFDVEINFRNSENAIRASFFPGVSLVDEYTVNFKCDNVRDFIITRMFVL